MKRLTCSVLASALVCGMAWLWGFDFDERGNTALIVAYVATVAGGLVYALPTWSIK